MAKKEHKDKAAAADEPKKHESGEHDQAPGAPKVSPKVEKELDIDKDKEEGKAKAHEREEVSGQSGSSDEQGQSPEATPEKQHAPAADEPKDQAAIDSKQTDEAVEDIIRVEGDELLTAQDSAAGETVPPPKKPRKWKWLIWTVVIIALIGLIVAMLVPGSRYAILNALGVRVSASVTVLDNTTKQPLKNVTVSIGDKSAETNEKGEATLENLKQGKQKLTIERIAFAKVERDVILGWGSNPLGTFELNPAGVQYTFIIRDHLSDSSIKGAEVSSGKLAAASDEHGKAVLTIQETDEDHIPIKISANGYRTEDLSLQIATEDDVQVSLVPSNKAVFAARGDDGRINVYGAYIDGKDRSVLLAGTGRESSDSMSLAVSPDGTHAAVVSTREDIKAEDGTLLQSLTLINTSSGDTKTLDRALDIRLIDWIGSTLVYQMTMPGTGQDSDERQRLVGYEYGNDKRAELASANNFASVASAQGAVYYSAAVSGDSQGALTQINPDGTNKKEVLNVAVQHAYRTDYGTLTVQASDGWHRIALSSDEVSKIAAPSNPANHAYINNSDGTKGLWVDGDALTVYNVSEDKDTRADSRSGLSYPVYWLTSDVVVYQASSIDYAISLAGGDAQRIASVLPVNGLVKTY
jgi:hypothetical protein